MLGGFWWPAAAAAPMTAAETLVLDFAGSSIAGSPLQWMLPEASDATVAVAVPPWLGMADRHQLLRYLSPDGGRPLTLVSSTLAGACGRYPGRSTRRARPEVLCIDARLGWSAGLVRFGPDGGVEVAAWGIGPQEVAGRLDDSVTCPWFIDHLLAAASPFLQSDSVRVLVVDDVGVRADLIRHALRQHGEPWTRSSMLVGRGRELVLPGGLQVSRVAATSRPVGALAHALTVRADADPERVSMHVIAAEHVQIPSTTRQLFELGPDDGAPLHFDIYEQHRGAPDDDPVEHRLVVRAHLVRERGYDQTMMVTFQLSADGLLSVGPANAWALEWQPGSLDLEPFG